MMRRPPRSPLFPYPPLSRSVPASRGRRVGRLAERAQQPSVPAEDPDVRRSEEHTSELQSQSNLVCRLLLEKKKQSVLKMFVSVLDLSSPMQLHVSFATHMGD